jgi:hypothetical protein
VAIKSINQDPGSNVSTLSLSTLEGGREARYFTGARLPRASGVPMVAQPTHSSARGVNQMMRGPPGDECQPWVGPKNSESCPRQANIRQVLTGVKQVNRCGGCQPNSDHMPPPKWPGASAPGSAAKHTYAHSSAAPLSPPGGQLRTRFGGGVQFGWGTTPLLSPTHPPPSFQGGVVLMVLPVLPRRTPRIIATTTRNALLPQGSGSSCALHLALFGRASIRAPLLLAL